MTNFYLEKVKHSISHILLFYFYFKMDNVLRETIRTEIKAILSDKESRNEAPNTQIEKFKKKLTRD